MTEEISDYKNLKLLYQMTKINKTVLTSTGEEKTAFKLSTQMKTIEREERKLAKQQQKLDAIRQTIADQKARVQKEKEEAIDKRMRDAFKKTNKLLNQIDRDEKKRRAENDDALKEVLNNRGGLKITDRLLTYDPIDDPAFKDALDTVKPNSWFFASEEQNWKDIDVEEYNRLTNEVRSAVRVFKNESLVKNFNIHIFDEQSFHDAKSDCLKNGTSYKVVGRIRINYGFNTNAGPRYPGNIGVMHGYNTLGELKNILDKAFSMDAMQNDFMQLPLHKSNVSLIGLNMIRVTFYLRNETIGTAIGKQLPKWIMKTNSVFSASMAKNNNCFFLCLAKFLNPTTIPRTLCKKANILMKSYLGEKKKNYEGIKYPEEIETLEDFFNIGVNIWKISNDEESTELVRSANPNLPQMHLILELDSTHFCLMLNKNAVLGKYPCSVNGCCRIFKRKDNQASHSANCKGGEITFQDVFPNTKRAWTGTRNAILDFLKPFDQEEIKNIIQYEENGKSFEQQLNDYVFVGENIVFDFEAYQYPIEFDKSKQLKLQFEHTPVMFSILSSVSPQITIGIDECDNDNFKLVKKFIDLATEQSKLIYNKLEKKYASLIHVLSPTNVIKLRSYIKSTPLCGFNSGKYDLNLIASSGLFTCLTNSCENNASKFQKVDATKCDNRFKMLKNEWLSFVDIYSFQSPDVKLEQFISKYNLPMYDYIKNNPTDKFPPAREVCGDEYEFMVQSARKYANIETNSDYIQFYNKCMKKLKIDYSYSMNPANWGCPFPPPYDKCIDYLSGLDHPMKREDYDMMVKTGTENGCKTIRDYLLLYQNADVLPFSIGIDKSTEVWKDITNLQGTDCVDPTRQAIGLPTLAKIVANNFSLKGVGRFTNDIPTNDNMISLDLKRIQQKIDCHKRTDKERNDKFQSVIKQFAENNERKIAFKKACESKDCQKYFGKLCDLTPKDIVQCHSIQQGRCFHCHVVLNDTANDNLSWSIDRKDNNRGHTKDNFVLSCVKCNLLRKDVNFEVWSKRMLFERYAKNNPVVRTFDDSDDSKACYFDMRKQIVGGASIVFHRYHEKDKTYIHKKIYDYSSNQFKDMIGSLVKSVLCVDANSLYPFSFGMMDIATEFVKRHSDVGDKKEFLDKVVNGSMTGFVICKIKVPDNLLSDYSEFPPFFITRALNESKDRKLISVLSADNFQVFTPLLKWYISRFGYECIEKIYVFDEFKIGKPYREFVEMCADKRRQGGIFGDVYKLVMNSFAGKAGQNNEGHSSITYADKETYLRRVGWENFKDCEVYSSPDASNVYEIQMSKLKIKHDMPLHMGQSVYQNSKLHMLQFFYEFIHKYFDSSKYQLCYTDTDSLWFALSEEGDNYDGLFKCLKDHIDFDQFELEKKKYLVFNKYDEKTPGLFKVECKSSYFVGLCSKLYIADDIDKKKEKIGAKGVSQKTNKPLLCKDNFLKVLTSGQSEDAINRGMRVVNHKYTTYEQKKVGLSSNYEKRITYDNCFCTSPLLNVN